MDNQFVLAMYLRISSNDEEYGDSQSITGQRYLINEYIRTHTEFKNAHVIEFLDDGYSGMNFERPGIIKLLEKAKNGEINAVIVKDFSRFGRNYIDVGDYIEQIFPFLNVRFVSVNDNFDSATQQSVGDVGISFKHICNAYYCEDISRKVKASLKTAWESGKQLSRGIYGYKADPMDKYKLIIDEDTYPIVRRIFKQAGLGETPSQIALALNEENVLSPLRYLISTKKVKAKDDSKKVWIGSSVIRIIRDLRYTGLLIQGMTAPQAEWFVHQGKLEAIVTQEEFEKAQNCIKKVKRTKPNTAVYSLPVKIICGSCGHKMTRSRKKSGAYYCSYAKITSDNSCSNERIEFDTFKSTMLSSIQQYHNLIERKNDNENSTPVDILKQIQFLEKELSNFSNAKLILYNRYSDGKLSYNEYLIKQSEADKKSENLTIQINKLKKDLLVAEENLEPATEILKSVSYPTEYSDELASALIDSVIVYDENHIEIKWKFKDFFNDKT